MNLYQQIHFHVGVIQKFWIKSEKTVEQIETFSILSKGALMFT